MRLSMKAVSLFLIVFALARGAGAAEAAELPDREVAQRLDYLQHALDRGERTATVWRLGWIAGYGGATVGELAIRSRADSDKGKQDALVGAATSAVGALGSLFTPLGASHLPARLRSMPGDSPEQGRAKLTAAERFLRESAADEIRGRSWQAHALAGAVNLGAGLVVALHYKRPADGFLTFAVGQLISEVQIFTQPMRAVRDLRDYEHRSDFASASAADARRVTWYLGATPGGFAVGCRF